MSQTENLCIIFTWGPPSSWTLIAFTMSVVVDDEKEALIVSEEEEEEEESAEGVNRWKRSGLLTPNNLENDIWFQLFDWFFCLNKEKKGSEGLPGLRSQLVN